MGLISAIAEILRAGDSEIQEWNSNFVKECFQLYLYKNEDGHIVNKK